LLVVDIADPAATSVIDEVPAFTPYGLAIRDSLLYVSNGYNGFSLYNTADPKNVRRIKYWDTPATKDFIWMDSTLYIMNFTGITINNVANPENPLLLSKID
jgi:hypothetical protein